MPNFKFIQLECKDYEVVTNMPRSCVSYALEQGFEVVDASTWKPVSIENHNNDWIAEMFYNGSIDLVRKVG